MTPQAIRESSPTLMLLVGYVVLLAAAVTIFLAIAHYGERLVSTVEASAASVVAAKPGVTVHVVLHVFATLAAVIAVGNLLGRLFRGIGQPAVIGEVVAGIVLGPSLLGALSPDAMHWLIPGPAEDPDRLVVTALGMIAQLGVVLYLFVVGLDLNVEKVGRYAHAAVAISHASIVLPFVLGAGLALWIYPVMSPGNVSFTSFALFLGTAMSITAFPVLARILTDRGLEKSDLGIVALSCAATDDATAWCLLAVVVGVARSQVGDALVVATLALLFVMFMFLIVRPLLRYWITRCESLPVLPSHLSILVVGALLSALATEAIGIHAAFGAFLFGAVIPHESELARRVAENLRMIVTVVFLPAFFAITGMNTEIGLISGVEDWLICAVIILVATLGKVGGTMMASRFAGLSWTTSGALGVLMNTRGLMELIVLNIGLSLGVISPRLYAMMVIMALVTTAATAPVLNRLVPAR